MPYTIKSFIASDGERFSLIFNHEEGGFPQFYPTAFIVRAIRLRTSHETQKVYLNAIKRICEWESSRKIVLTERFQQQKFLSIAEVDDLVRHISAARRGSPGDTIGRAKSSIYIGYAATYLNWLASEVITESNTSVVRDAIAEQDRRLMAKTTRKQGSKSAQAQQLITKKLPDEARAQLLSLFDDPFQHLTQSTNRGTRFRNVVMLRILYETGMRRGELLSEKLNNFQESSGATHASLKIERNHHDEYDSRINQPVAKTRGRIVPISKEAEEQLQEYIGRYRAEVPRAGFSDKSFMFINHRAGHSQGHPLSESALHAALENLKRTFPTLTVVHPHLLRHDWNYRFSQKAKQQELPQQREREIREALMGWAYNSEMSGIYNARFIQTEADLIGLEIANHTQRQK